MSLDSDDEESSAHNEEEIVNSFKVTSKDKDTLLPRPKSKTLKHFVNFLRSRFKCVFLITYRPMSDIMSVCKLLLIFRPLWGFFPTDIDALKFVKINGIEIQQNSLFYISLKIKALITCILLTNYISCY